VDQRNVWYGSFMDETWLPVIGFEGIYEVSDLGQIRTVERVAMRSNGRPHRVKSTIRATKSTAKGYRTVTLVRDAKLSTYTVHKLVAEAFLGQRPPDHVVRHLNGDPSDNRLANLAWGTHSDNQRDSLEHGTHALAAKTHCLRGHLLDAPNLATTPSRRRICLACKREYDQAHWEGREFDPKRADARYEDVLAGRRRHKSQSRF